MKDKTLPPGIRTHTAKDGSITYEARVNRQGIKGSQRFPILKSATGWKSLFDYAIETGSDLTEFLEKAPTAADTKLARITEKTPLSALNRPMQGPHPVNTVDEAVAEYVRSRQDSPDPIKPNNLTDYERVKQDLKGLNVSSLEPKNIVAYLSALSKMPRKRDDPNFIKPRKTAVVPETSLSAKAQANKRYKERLRAEKTKAKDSSKPPKPLSEATVRKFFYALKKSIDWHAKNGGQVNPFLFKLEKGQMPRAWAGQRERRLVADEESRLYAAGIDRGGYTYTPDDWRALIGFALETGMREQELAKVEWKDIWADGYKLTIRREISKTEKERQALLSKAARDIIEVQQATCPKNNKRIFHQFPNAKAICDAFAKLTVRACIGDLHFHDLRHEATSRLCESGKLQLMEIMGMTGHESMVTFNGYVKLIAHENDRRLD
jgi:integrase